VRLADALNQLYVLLPVLDESKHYWQGPDEVDKLLRSGDGWLANHPDKNLITLRYRSIFPTTGDPGQPTTLTSPWASQFPSA
jgi:hypothetical protein